MNKSLIGISALIFAIVAATVVATMPAQKAVAQSSVMVTQHGVENRFPDGLRFYIDAESVSPIEEIRVYVRKLGQSSRSAYRSVEFAPGSAISGEALFQSRTANEHIPTGTRLSYYFSIRTADGNVVETEPAVIVYLNRGLNWDKASEGLINVYYYHHNDQSEERADAVLAVAADTYNFMKPILGVELTEPMNIVVYSNYQDMRAALPPASRVAQQQLRTLGQAHTNERTLLVDGSMDFFAGDNLRSTSAHEFTHLLVADAAGSAYGQVHTWLNEGLAVYSERNPGNEYDRYMQAAIRNERVPPLSSLRTYAGTPVETLRNYGQGHAVVAYMLDTYGPGKMVELFEALRSIHNFEKALSAAYGVTIPELDNQWRENVGLAPRDLSTPPLPPLQVLPTRRHTPTPVAAMTEATGPSTPAPAPSATPAPTYTPKPMPVVAEAPPTQDARQTGGEEQSPSSGGCGAAAAHGDGAASELASIVTLAFPVGLLALTAIRRRRNCRKQDAQDQQNCKDLSAS